MVTVFSCILRMSIEASIVAVVIMLSRLCLRSAPKLFSYIMWGVVFFRLVCPFSFVVEFPFEWLPDRPTASYIEPADYQGNFPSFNEHIPIANNTNDEQHIPQNISTANGNQQTAVPDSDTEPLYTNNYDNTNDIKYNVGKIWFYLSVAWLVGLGALFVYTAAVHISLYKRLKYAIRIRENIYQSEQINTIFVLGIFNPKIYFPSWLNPDHAQSVIMHEQTHIKRKDYIIKFIAFCVLCLHWFNPIIWLSYGMMCFDMERSCDEAVIRKLCGQGYRLSEVKRGYGEQILTIAKKNISEPMPVSFAGNSTKERMRNVMRYKPAKNRIITAASILCVLSMLVCLVSCVSAPGVLDSTDTKAGVKSSSAKILTIDGVTFSSDVTELDLSGIVGGNGITDISVLSECTSLEHLNLSYNSISDLSPLKNCISLKALNLQGNSNISDFTIISKLTSLESLELSECGISSNDVMQMSYFSGLPNLRHLGIAFAGDNVSLSQIDCLDRLTFLRADINNQDDFDALDKMRNAAELSLVWNIDNIGFDENDFLTDFTDYSPLHMLEKLKSLNILPHWNITKNTIEAISDIKSLRNLDIAGVLSDENAYSALASLSQLDELHIELIPEISSLSFLNGLTSLKALDVLCSLNRVDISSLRSLENLEKLTISGAVITDTEALSSLKRLTYLDLNGCDIFGFDNIIWPESLKHIGLLGTGDGIGDSFSYSISNISFLKELPNLEYLEFNPRKELNDISCLSTLKNLKYLLINGDTMISDLSPLTELDSLQYLCVRGIFNDISPLSGCGDMRQLSLRGGFDDISILSEMKSLNTLDLGSDRLSDISALGELSLLRSLSLQNTVVSDISTITKCQALYSLDIDSRELKDASPLGTLTQLKELSISNAPINDISFVGSIRGLKKLSLYCTNVSDISSLSKCEMLNWLRLYGNSIEQRQIDEFTQKHPDCQMEFEENIG